MAVLWMHPSVSAVEFFLYHVSVCVARAMCFQNSFSVLACIHMQEEMFNPLYCLSWQHGTEKFGLNC